MAALSAFLHWYSRFAQESARAGTPEAPSTAADRRVVEGWLESYSASLNAGDLAAFGKLWADGAQWALPDAPVLEGRQAILEHVRAVVEKYSLHHEFTSQAFRLEGGLGVALLTSKERYSPKAGGGTGWEQSVKGAVVLRREDDGSWIATYLIWNRDAPPPPGEIQPPKSPR